MTIVPQSLSVDSDALALVVQLRNALQVAANELQRRCVISGQVNDALRAADLFIDYHRPSPPPVDEAKPFVGDPI